MKRLSVKEETGRLFGRLFGRDLDDPLRLRGLRMLGYVWGFPPPEVQASRWFRFRHWLRKITGFSAVS